MLRFLDSPLLSLLCFLALVSDINGSTQNFTIDDTFGDTRTGANTQGSSNPTYFGNWSSSVSCLDATTQVNGEVTACSAAVNATLAFDGSWTATAIGSASMDIAFVGTAIYVFFIVPGIVDENFNTSEVVQELVLVGTNISFTLDGEDAESFVSSVPMYNVSYNALGYSNHTLANSSHTLSITNSEIMTDPSNASNSLQPVVFFDRAIYTLNTDGAQPNQPSSSGESSSPTRISVSGEVAHSSNTGPLVGGVFGGIAFIGLVVSTLFVFIRRRTRQRIASQRIHVEPLDVTNLHARANPERKRPLPMISQLPGQRSLFVTEKALSRVMAAQAQAFPPEEHHPVLPTVQPTVAITPSRTDQGADRTSLAELGRPSTAPEEPASLGTSNGNEGEISQNDRERIARLEAEMEYLRAEREVRPGEDLPAYDNLAVGQRVD